MPTDALPAGLAVFASPPLPGSEVPGFLTSELVAFTTRREHWHQAVTALDRPVLSKLTLQRIADVLGT